MATSVGPDGIDVSGYGWTNQSTQFNSNVSLESQAGPTSTAITAGLTSGTAKVLNAQFDTMLYITTNTAGTALGPVAIGPTSSVPNVVAAATASAVVGNTVAVLVPAGWFVKATFTAANVTVTAVTTKL